jgi:flagellar biosynthetic protein FliQ
MGEAEIIRLLREFLWAGVVMGAPVIVAGLVAGVAIGLFQALTSIQEQTLVFAPKLIVMLAVFWATAGYAARLLVSLFNAAVIPFVAG